MIAVAATGFFTAFSLILTIGAQNAFVMRQGLLRQHVFAICLFCALSDAILITFGVAGFGWLVQLNPNFSAIMAVAGAVFLLFYALTRFKVALKGDYDPTKAKQVLTPLWPTLLTAAALTWLNPHVYLDTLGLIGMVSSQYTGPGEKLVFGMAAVTSSFTFFFGFGYGARLLDPIMQTARAWQVFDILVGIIMVLIALGLIVSVF